jgi:hypothetical protein
MAAPLGGISEFTPAVSQTTAMDLDLGILLCQPVVRSVLIADDLPMEIVKAGTPGLTQQTAQIATSRGLTLFVISRNIYMYHSPNNHHLA